MNFKICIITFILSYNVFLQPSSDNAHQSKVENIVLTAARIADSRAKQEQARAKEKNKIKVGTVDTLHGAIYQSFVYGGTYRKIGLDVFFEKYSKVVDDLNLDAQNFYSLSNETQAKIYEALKLNPHQRNIDEHIIVGNIPSSSGFRDRIFNISKAQDFVNKRTQKYIDTNYSDVCKNCVNIGLSTMTSLAIVNPGCCDLQLHKSCFIRSQKNGVVHCVNSFCQDVQKGERTVWTDVLYEEGLTKKPHLKSNDIRDADCPVCMEPLKQASCIKVLVKRSDSKSREGSPAKKK